MSSSPPKSRIAAKQPGKTVVPVVPLSRIKRSAPSTLKSAHARPSFDDAALRPIETNGQSQTQSANGVSLSGFYPESSDKAQAGNSGCRQEAEDKGPLSLDVSTPSPESAAPVAVDKPVSMAGNSVTSRDAQPAPKGEGDGILMARDHMGCNGSHATPQSQHPMQRQASDSESSCQTSTVANGLSIASEANSECVEHSTAQTPAPPLLPPPPYVTTRNLGQMAPCPPTNRPSGALGRGEFIAGPQPCPNAPQHMHQAHLSNGSIHFGNFHDSHNSSPAPPLSGGIPPPPGLPGLDGRTAHTISHGLVGNTMSPLTPYGAEMAQVANMDSFARPAVSYALVDAYPPYGANYGPQTPRGFQDGQSPAQFNEDAMFGQLTPRGNTNGEVASAGAFRPLNYPRMMANVGPQPMMPYPDNGDGLIGYIQQLFGSANLADCMLELVGQLHDGTPLMRIPAHRIVLSRSPKLSTLSQVNRQDKTLPTLLLKTDNKWVRSDSFYMAVQRLYGLPLLLGLPPGRPYAGESSSIGSTDQQFDFALSYAAAGDLLGLGPVVRRGCEVAAQLLSWHNVEKGLEFALDDLVDQGTHESFKYGDGSRILLDAVVAFVLQNMPPKFEVVTREEELGGDCRYARLPACPRPSPKVATEVVTAQKPAQKPAVQLGRGRRPQQIVQIQFGDLSISEDEKCTGSETSRNSHEAQPMQHLVLSRVLLNLPFSHLRIIAESSVPVVASQEVRNRVLKQAVDGREARRVSCLEAVIDGRVGSDSKAMLTALESPTPRTIGPWTALGWEEELVYRGNSDNISVKRSWVPVVRRHSMGSANAQFP